MLGRLLYRFQQRRNDCNGAQSAASSSTSKSSSMTSAIPPAPLPPNPPTQQPISRRQSGANGTVSEPVRPRMPWDGKLIHDIQPRSTTPAEGAARARSFRRCLFKEKRNKDWRSYAVFCDDDEGEDKDVEDLCWRGKSWNAPVRCAKTAGKENKEKMKRTRWSQIRFGNFGRHG